MHDRVTLFELAQNVAQHAAARQNVIAQNVANADTPGYRAQELTPLVVEAAPSFQMRRSSPLHLSGTDAQAFETRDSAALADPNGNTVSLEEQVLASVDAGRTHDRALTIYQTSLGILRSALGKGG